MALPSDAAFATLLMNDAYLPGAMVLGHSLRDKSAKVRMIVLVTLDTVSAESVAELETVFDEIVPVDRIQNRSPANLYTMNRPDLISTFTKIELWRQTQYRRIVYIDADVVALRVPSELLTRDTDFAAVPDIGWPDCFNSGVMVLNPDMGEYYSLLALAQRGISFDGADQGLLNTHFGEWERLSFTYNCTPSANYQYLPAYRHFQSSINMIHFIGKDKPWTLGRENNLNSGVYGELLGMWWAVYDRHYRAQQTGRYSRRSRGNSRQVQELVAGEKALEYDGFNTKASQSTLERPMGDPMTPGEEVRKADFKPRSTAEVRRFSAPLVDWEPSRAPPPIHSKPEASNFPTQVYEFSSDSTPFQPPAKYPEPPNDMWYQVPEKAPEQPKPRPIFPWEAHAPKATRVFPQYKAPSPPPQTQLGTTLVDPSSSAGNVPEAGESPPTPAVGSPDPWGAFQQRGNAWDDIPEIDQYVHAFSQARRGKIQVLHHTPSQPEHNSTEQRRPSMKLTDFPTEIERPSLPVTPAPIRRPSFWGEERDQHGALPAAEGVPHQDEWDPMAKLEELQRRQSQLLESGPELETTKVPIRTMPESASREAAEAANQKATSPERTPKIFPQSILKEPKIGVIEDIDSSTAKKDDKRPTSTGPSFNPIVLEGEAASLSTKAKASEAGSLA